tara:strand:+ start:1482 stop:2201 length:720 start_codon:yes stop_codon:yes gene_type:complete
MRNYLATFSDRYFYKSFFNSLSIMVFVIPALVYVAYKIAASLDYFTRATQAVFRFVLYIPSLAAGMVMSLIWRWFIMPEGLVNQLLVIAGLPAIGWLAYAWPARIAASAVHLFASVGGTVLLFSAAICAIPSELRDAALIDGCGTRGYRRYVIRPMIRRMMLLCVLLNIVGVMQIWEISYMLFPRGGPEGSVASPVYEIFMTAFGYNKQGYAAAKGVMLMIIIASILYVKQRVERWAKF